MASKKKNKTIVESDKNYILLYDTFGAGLTTFSFGLDVIRGGEELEEYIITAAMEIWDDTDDLEDKDIPEDKDILSITDQIIVLEVTEEIDIANILRKNKKVQEDEERKLYERLKKKFEQK